MFRTITANEASELTGCDITRELDKVKSKVFLGDSAAFLASVMTSMDFEWSDSIPTAATNGATFWWNPKFFMSLEFDTRKMVLMHELWHAALLHMVRRGERDPKIWNYACDIRINNGLENDGFSFKGVKNCWKDQAYGLQSEEDIYDQLTQNAVKIDTPVWGSAGDPSSGQGSGQNGGAGQDSDEGEQEPDLNGGDMVPCDKQTQMQAVNNVVRAIHQANLAGQPGSVPGGLQEIIDKFLTPVVPWEQLLQRWMQDLLDHDYTWARPNRRYQDTYLPSRFQDEGRLEHLMFFQDCSGSMWRELQRTNSEIKYIWDSMKPKKMTTVQFDTEIQKVDEFVEGDRYEKMEIHGLGGTDLREVREMIIKTRPTAAVIFTDLYVEPMAPLPFNIPILWVTKTDHIQVPFGDLIIIKE